MSTAIQFSQRFLRNSQVQRFLLKRNQTSMAIATYKQLITEQINHICCGYTFYSLHRPDTSKLYDCSHTSCHKTRTGKAQWRLSRCWHGNACQEQLSRTEAELVSCSSAHSFGCQKVVSGSLVGCVWHHWQSKETTGPVRLLTTSNALWFSRCLLKQISTSEFFWNVRSINTWAVGWILETHSRKANGGVTTKN